MQHLPACKQHTIYVGLGFQDIRRLSIVGRSWSDTGRNIQEKIVAAAKAFCDRGFRVEALGELFNSAENKETRLRTLMKGLPVDDFHEMVTIDDFSLRWWYEAQLHLHLFCHDTIASASASTIASESASQRNVISRVSVVDIARRVFEYEQICDANLFEQVFYVVLHNELEIEYDLLLAVSIPINSSVFYNRAFVTKQEKAWGSLSAPAPWSEVLMTLLCLLRGESYCPYLCGCSTCLVVYI